jgi:hypothetical protein
MILFFVILLLGKTIHEGTRSERIEPISVRETSWIVLSPQRKRKRRTGHNRDKLESKT